MKPLIVLHIVILLSFNLYGNPENNKDLRINFSRAISMAIANNYELRAVQAKAGIYQYSIYERLREYFPSLNFSYYQIDEVNRRESDDREKKFTIESEILIYDGGMRSLNYDIAKLDAILARNDYRLALNKLIVEVRNSFLDLINLKEKIKIYKKTLQAAELQHKFIKKEFDLGDSTKLSVMEIEAKVKEVELSLKKSQGEYSSSLNNFKLLLKLNWKTPVEVDGDVDRDFRIISVKELKADELVSIALKRRKEIESSIVQLEIKKRNYLISKNYFMPKFSVGLNYNLTGEEFPPREKGWGVTFKVSSKFMGSSLGADSGYSESSNKNSRTLSKNASLGVLDNMDYKRSILESKIDLYSAEGEKKDTREGVSIEIESLCKDMINSSEMIDIAKQQLELYDSQLKIERLKADMGESRRYDLLEKEIERAESAVALMDSKIKYLKSVSTMEIAMGVDVDFLNKYLLKRADKYEKNNSGN